MGGLSVAMLYDGDLRGVSLDHEKQRGEEHGKMSARQLRRTRQSDIWFFEMQGRFYGNFLMYVGQPTLQCSEVVDRVICNTNENRDIVSVRRFQLISEQTATVRASSTLRGLRPCRSRVRETLLRQEPTQ